MLDIRSLSVDFGRKVLFIDVTLMLLPNNRYGVVGANGTGKSTFLKVLAGEEMPNEGRVEKPKNVSIGILKQDHFSYENESVMDVVIQGNSILWNALKEKKTLLEQTHFNEEEGYRLTELEENIMHQERK